MMLKRSIAGAIAALSLVNVAPEAQAQSTPSGGVSYVLPVTVARVSLALTLTRCDQTGFSAIPLVAVDPLAAASEQEPFRFDPPRSSWWRKRNVKIELYPNGVIKSVNAGGTDERLNTLVSLVKVALAWTPTMMGAGAVPPPEPPPVLPVADGSCRPAVIAALGQVAALNLRIVALRGELVQPDAKVEDITAAIDGLASEVARLKTGPLRLILIRDLKLESSSEPIFWRGDQLSAWFDGLDPVRQYTAFSLSTCANVAASGACTAVTMPDEPAPCADGGEECLVLREPVQATMAVVATPRQSGFEFSGPADAQMTLWRGPISVAQWGQTRTFDMGARFGEQWSAGMSFDALGRQSMFEMNSEARSTPFRSGLDGLSSASLATRAALDTYGLNAMKAETAELEAQRTLNRLRYCEQFIAAGGFVCPVDPASPSVP